MSRKKYSCSIEAETLDGFIELLSLTLNTMKSEDIDPSDGYSITMEQYKNNSEKEDK